MIKKKKELIYRGAGLNLTHLKNFLKINQFYFFNNLDESNFIVNTSGYNFNVKIHKIFYLDTM